MGSTAARGRNGFADQHGMGQVEWRRALTAALERTGLRFRLEVAEENPRAGEVLLHFDPAVAGPGRLKLHIEPLSLVESIENTLRLLPDRTRGVHLELDKGQIPDGKLPDQKRLEELCRSFGAGTPVIESTSLNAGQWYRAERLEWREFEVPYTHDTRAGGIPEDPGTSALAALRWHEDGSLENPSDGLVLLRRLALRPQKTVPWEPPSEGEFAQVDGRLDVVDPAAAFNLPHAHRIDFVEAARAAPSPVPAAMIPNKRCRAQLTYRGAVLKTNRTVLLRPSQAGRVDLSIATGPENTRWFRSRESVTLVGEDPADQVPCPPEYFFVARNFQQGEVHFRVNEGNGPDEAATVDVTYQRKSIAWELIPFRKLSLALGSDFPATFELRWDGAGRTPSANRKLILSVEQGRPWPESPRRYEVPMGKAFQLDGHRFVIEEVR